MLSKLKNECFLWLVLEMVISYSYSKAFGIIWVEFFFQQVIAATVLLRVNKLRIILWLPGGKEAIKTTLFLIRAMLSF